MQWIPRLFSALVVGSVVAACGGGGDGPAGPVPVANVHVTVSGSLFEGASAQAQAVAVDASGSPLSGRSVSWSSTNQAVATVDGSGMVTGVSAGNATINATSEGKTGSATVTVTRDPTVASVAISASGNSIQSRGNLQLTIAVKNGRGQDLSGQTITYASSATSVATVSATGLVTSVGPTGTTNITASVGSVTSAPFVLTVTPGPVASLTAVTGVPASAQFGSTNPISVKATDAAGNAVPGAAVYFALTSTIGGSVTASATSDASGIATASFTLGTAVGTYTASATAPGASNAVSFPATPTGLGILSGNNQTAPVGSDLTVAVRLTDAAGNPIVGVQVQFNVEGPTGPEIHLQHTDANGVATYDKWQITKTGENDLIVNYGTLPQLTIKATGT